MVSPMDSTEPEVYVPPGRLVRMASTTTGLLATTRLSGEVKVKAAAMRTLAKAPGVEPVIIQLATPPLRRI